MVEILNLTIHTIEISQMTGSVMKDFMKSKIPYLVLQNQGKYAGVYIREYNQVITDAVKCEWGGVKSLRAIRDLFVEYKDRGKLVAILDNDGCLMTFFAWNQMAERDSAYLECCKQKMLNLLENGYDIALEDWNEYTADFVQFLSSKNKLTGHIFLTGDNWELSVFYSQYERIEKNSKQIRVTKEGIFYPTEEKIVYSLKKVNEVYLHKSVYFYLGLSKGKYDYTKIAKYMLTFGTMPDGFCKLRSWGREQFFLGRDVVDLETLGARPDILVVTDADEKIWSVLYIMKIHVW